MLDKYLKIFGLDNNFSLDELEDKHKRLLKEFDTKNIEEDLKIIFLEEQVKIQEAYLILLKYHHKQEKAGQIKSGNKPSSPKVSNKKNQQKKIVLGISILLVLFIGAFFAYFSGIFMSDSPEHSGGVVPPTETCDLVLKDNSFKVNGQKSKKSAEAIYNCFVNKWIKVDETKYTLSEDYQIKAKREDDASHIIKEDSILKDLIISLEKANNSKLVIKAIEKVRNYNKLISDDGLEGNDFIWFWQNDKLECIEIRRGNNKRMAIDENMYKSQKSPIKQLFETKPIPASVLTDIMTYLNTIDGKAIVIVEGCTNKHYTEYDRNANKDDGSCKTKKKGCMDKDYKEYNKYALINKQSDCKNKIVKGVIKGCTNPKALNYDPTATKNDGSCKFPRNPVEVPQITTCPFDHQKYNCKKKLNSLNAARKKLKDIKGSNKFNYDVNVVNAEIATICAEIEVWKGIIKNGSCICTKKNTQIAILNKPKCN